MHPKHTGEGPNPSGLCMCGCGRPTRLARQSSRHQGVVRGKPVRCVIGHGGRTYPPVAYAIDAETGCWVWQGLMKDNGYGALCIDNVLEYAHRWSYRTHRGPIPEGMELDHLCRNRACVNPDHIEPVERAMNVRRGSASTLTVDNVRKIRAACGATPIKVLAEQYGVDPSTVSRVVSGERWKGIH